jgi:hypothetical protein
MDPLAQRSNLPVSAWPQWGAKTRLAFLVAITNTARVSDSAGASNSGVTTLTARGEMLGYIKSKAENGAKPSEQKKNRR